MINISLYTDWVTILLKKYIIKYYKILIELLLLIICQLHEITDIKILQISFINI